MAQATDANISKLQQMFPKVEGDVIAILLNDCGNDVEKCINHLLVLSSDTSPGTDHSQRQRQPSQGRHSEGTTPGPSGNRERDSWKEVTSNSKSPRNNHKRPQHKKQGKIYNSRPPATSSQSDRQQFPPGGHGNRVRSSGPQGRGSNYGDRPHPPETVEGPEDRWRKRDTNTFQQGDNYYQGGGTFRRPPLIPYPPPGPRGFIRPPGNFRPPPNYQNYPNGRPFRGPPPWREPGPPLQRPPHTLQPRIIPAGNGPLPPGGVPMGPNGTPVVYSGTPMEPNGTLMGPRFNGMPVVNPQMTSIVDQTPTDHQSWSLLTSSPLPVYPHELISSGFGDLSHALLSDSHTSIPSDHQNDQGKGGWPIVTEPGTEHGNPTEASGTHKSRSDTNGEFDREPVDLAEAGKEWLKWDGGSPPLTTNKKLVVLRGLPGSGKSTFARQLAGKDGIICSTDDHFYVNGRYVFDPNKLSENHEKNKENAHQAMLIEITPVVIDNTNTSAWEMKPYVELAHSLGYEVEILEPDTPWKFDCVELARRNSHGVPQEKIEKMLARYDHHVTVESILSSQPPPARAPPGSARGNGGGRGSRLTPAHPHYARKHPLPSSQSHKPPSQFSPSSWPVSSTSTPSVPSSAATGPNQSPPDHSSLTSTLPVNGKLLTNTLKSSTPSVSQSSVQFNAPSSVQFNPPSSVQINPPSSVQFNPPSSVQFNSPSSVDTNTLIPPFRTLTKDEEEQAAAKISCIWGDGRLSDDTESVLRQDEKTSNALLGWTEARPTDSNSIGLGHRAENSEVEFAHPAPCKFGPIGKPSKSSLVPNVNNSGTTLVTNGQANNGNSTTSVVRAKTGCSPQGKSDFTQETSRKPIKRSILDRNEPTSPPPPSLPVKERSPSVELWVSEEVDTWPYIEATSDPICLGGRPGSDGESSASPCVPTPETSQKEAAVKGVMSVNPSNYQPSQTLSESSFEDPAIVNMVKQGVPLTSHVTTPDQGENHTPTTFEGWKDDFETESQELPPFTLASSESSPDAKQTSAPAPHTQSLMSTYSNRQSSITSAHSNVSTVSKTPQSSTPTVIPQENEALIMDDLGGGEGVKHFFPSAFENDKDPLLPVLHTEGGEIPNDVIVTSSTSHNPAEQEYVNKETDALFLPINSLPTTEKSSARRNLHSQLEGCGKIGSDFMMLEPLTSVQESSVDHGGYQPAFLALAGNGMSSQTQNGETLEAVSTAKEAVDLQSDLAFLKECFPDLREQFLQLLLEQNQGNVEETVSTALVSTVTSPVQPMLPQGTDGVFQYSPLKVYHNGIDWDWPANSADASSVTSESEVEGAGNAEFVFEDDECVNDEEIARIMQEQLDLAGSEGSSLQAVGREEGEPTLLGEQQDDDNLVLRLSRSLASQLQQMFGPVDKHLPLAGPLRDEDLQVLLSERAAHQIWQKWIDTLEAKKVEIQLHQDAIISRVQSAPVIMSTAGSKPAAPRGMEPSQPSNFTHIMNEQSAKETSSREVYEVVKAVCDKTMARKMKLRRLYGQFRSLDRDTINYILFKNNFNFSLAAQELAAAHEEQDGNASSQTTKSNPSSFARATGKQGSGGGKRGKAAAASRQPRRKRSTANKPRPTQLRRKEEAGESNRTFQELEDCPSYDDLRAEAALHAKLRSEAFQKAARARSLKQGEVASFYAQQGHSHTERMKEANMRAAGLILEQQNDLSSHYLDLHGLYVEEALAALHERLQSTTDKVLYVITGKGIHSKGEAKIKPAVIQYLRNKEYVFEEQPGRFLVKLA